jgi:nitroimidazol reductase NimA-like FMN-containing flavoprotein (pyridoxamine 5'-phosphate oxidase superfamily)
MPLALSRAACLVSGVCVASSVGILDDAKVLDVIKRRRVGRLSCAADGFTRVSAVHYDGVQVPDLYLQAPDPQCLALLRANPRVRLEVDDVQGPSQWETVLGWGLLEEIADKGRALGGRFDKPPLYKIHLDAVRGFYRTGSSRRHLD